MKTYIAPTVESIALTAEQSLMLAVSGELSTKPQLSNRMNAGLDADWDEE